MSHHTPMKKPPAAKTIRMMRKRARLSRGDAAAIIYKSEKAWTNWEQGERELDPALWELWLLKVDRLDLMPKRINANEPT